MRGSAAFRTAIAPGGVLAGPWVKNPLWRTARAVPSLDLPFANNKSLADAVTGQSLVTFTRASSGTYVGSDGVLRTAVTNLCLQSENFTTTWTNLLSTDAANTAIAPNGTLTADTLIPDSGAAAGLIRQDFSGATFTDNESISFSIYVKAAGLTSFNIQFYNKANTFYGTQTVNASTGGLSGSGTIASTTVTNVGDGWYRVGMTGISAGSGATGPNIRLVVTSTGDGTSGIYLWGAQLEQSATVGEYIPTTSTINSAPRFDHNPTTGESLGLLVEDQSTNGIRNNKMVGAAAGTPGTLPTNWAISNAGTLAANVIGTGTENGITYIDIQISGTSSTGGPRVRFEALDSITAASGQTWTGSFYVRQVSGSLTNINSITADVFTRDTAQTAEIETFTGSSLNASLGAASIIRNRVSITGTLTNASSTRVCSRITLNCSTSAAIDITLRIGLPQLEQGAFATSAIPTTTAAATRSADVASITGSNFSSWYRQDEGTVFTDTVNRETYPGANVFPYIIQIDGGTNDNRISHDNSVLNSGYRYNLPCNSGGVFQGELNQFGFASGAARWASAFRTNDFALAINLAPSVVSTRTSGTLPNVMTQLRIGSGFGKRFTGTIRRLVYWGQRLPNNVLQAITQ